jgi:putative heme iron utilization protein
MNQNSSSEELLQEINDLWSESFHCLLSTHSVKYTGYPFGSVLPICRDKQGQPLLMISHLAQHTRNLGTDARCSFTLLRSNHADVQQWTRLTCLADAQPVTSSSTLERYCRYYPEARRYHKDFNFNLLRLQPKQIYLIAGFGTARWFDVRRVLEAPSFQTAAELEILDQLHTQNHDLLKRFLAHQGQQVRDKAHAVGVDPEGLDIRQGEHLARLKFTSPISDEARFIEQLELAISS